MKCFKSLPSRWIHACLSTLFVVHTLAPPGQCELVRVRVVGYPCFVPGVLIAMGLNCRSAPQAAMLPVKQCSAMLCTVPGTAVTSVPYISRLSIANLVT